MTLSKRGDYVTRSAISLARAHPDGSRKIREVVAETAVPASFASQILADLVRSGLASSKAGRDGGYRLRRPPDEISLLEVIEAGEGPLRAERCALADGPCRWDQVCPLHETWAKATAALRELLANTTLAELAERDAALDRGDYQVPADAHRSHPSSVDVTDAVQVELGQRAATTALAKIIPSLPKLLQTALADTAGPAQAAGTGKRRVPPRRPEVSLSPTAQPAKETPDGAERYLLAWRWPEEPAGWLEAELSLAPLDPERCEITVKGSWHQYPSVTANPDALQLAGSAQRTLRSFLRALTRWLEAAAG
ncbi:MAG: RrF2 family transcriptional regulator [Mycobacteriales bacterium]